MMKGFAKPSLADEGIKLLEVPLPQIDEAELLVRVEAIGVGVHDEYFVPPAADHHYVIGIEAAGVVDRVGSDVVEFAAGDRVAFVNALQLKGGTWSEYTAVSKQGLVVHIPDKLSFEVAAALPVAGNTILRALKCLNLSSGDSLFIAGSSGAIGTLAIQIAVNRGFRVIASASAKNHAYMLSLGAHHVVDYHDVDWQDQVRKWFPGGVDAAIAVQPGTAQDSQPVIKDRGTIVAISGDQFTPSKQIVLAQLPHDLDVKNELVNLFDDVALGKVIPTIEKIYPFVDGLAALEKVKTRHARGKSILTMKPESS